MQSVEPPACSDCNAPSQSRVSSNPSTLPLGIECRPQNAAPARRASTLPSYRGSSALKQTSRLDHPRPLPSLIKATHVKPPPKNTMPPQRIQSTCLDCSAGLKSWDCGYPGRAAFCLLSASSPPARMLCRVALRPNPSPSIPHAGSQHYCAGLECRPRPTWCLISASNPPAWTAVRGRAYTGASPPTRLLRSVAPCTASTP